MALKKEKPDRSAAQVHRILVMRLPGQVPSARTIQRHFVRMELTGLAGAETAPETFGRFEASAQGELWVSDVLHGPPLGGQEDLPVRHRRRPLPVHHRALVDHQGGHPRAVRRAAPGD